MHPNGAIMLQLTTQQKLLLAIKHVDFRCGIDSLAAAKEKLAAGANLVQVYTAFIYQGPALVKSIVNGL